MNDSLTVNSLRNPLMDLWTGRRSYCDRGINHVKYYRYRNHRLPDFLIIGCQKGGTTSLFDDLARHPQVAASKDKEVHYFDLNYDKSANWYRSFFPLAPEGITGEASPYYLFHPRVPQRVKHLLPRCKLIVLLRNPVERAYSHYQHEVRHGAESLSFEEAIACENERIETEEKRLYRHPFYNSFNYRHYSYLARGLYAQQIERWQRFFAEERMLVLSSEQYFANPQATYNRLTDFLGIAAREPDRFACVNTGSYGSIESATRARLSAHFRPFNEQLYQLLDRDMGWD